MISKRKIFNTNVNFGKYQEFTDAFIEIAIDRVSKYVLFMNSHMVHEYHKNADFTQVVKNADIICPDGTPLLYSINLLKGLRSDRVAGNDMIFSMINEAEKNNLRVFFYGSTQQVLDSISDRLNTEYPKLEYKTYSPPFGDFDSIQLDKHSKMINDFGSHIVFVGLGCPKQETRMFQMKGKVNGLMLGLGGAFLLFAGVDSRAPKLMRQLSLEWVYRLCLEPKRLFKRYLVTNTYFCWLFMKEVFKTKES